MKLVIVLILLGGLLLIEGGSRITVGFVTGEMGLVVGGCLTGVGLGGFILYIGIKRYTNKRSGASTR